MSYYVLGVLTPFILIVVLYVVWLFSQLCHALVNWAMKKVHYRLIRTRYLNAIEVNPGGKREGLSIEPISKRFTEALIRDGGRFKYIPLFGWCVCIVRDYKTKPKEATNE